MGAVGWPYRTYLVNPHYRFVYCPVNKAACSSLKAWFLTTVGYRPDRPDWPERIHPFVDQRGLRDMRDLEQGFLRFIFVRDPWARLVSGYVQKFIRRWDVEESPARPVIAQVQQAAGQPIDYAAGITFREFVAYVCSTGDDDLDVHWKPQAAFMGGLRFDFIGRVERLAEDMNTLCDRLGIEERGFFALNRMEYTPPADGCMADVPAPELRSSPLVPDYTQFYTPELTEQVARRYERDLAQFGYPEKGPR